MRVNLVSNAVRQPITVPIPKAPKNTTKKFPRHLKKLSASKRSLVVRKTLYFSIVLLIDNILTDLIFAPEKKANPTYCARTMDTASFKTDSPKTKAYKFTSTRSSLNIAKTVT
jgi:hypothetical protein